MGIAQGSLSDIVSAVNFRALASETHDVNREGKTLCPFHADSSPSCHIYADGYKCFSCDAHGDALDWLEHVHNLSKHDAIFELKRRAGVADIKPKHRSYQTQTKLPEPCEAKPLSTEAFERYYKAMLNVEQVPPAFRERGFTLEDAHALMLCGGRKYGLMLIYDPKGQPIAVKKRYSDPQNGTRYQYATSGHGAPAWCSPSYILNTDRPANRQEPLADVLIIEGELNGMAAYLARSELAVMGVAGAKGKLHFEGLEGCNVYIYADPDKAGEAARKEWARAAFYAGAKTVRDLPSWSEGDACDIAAKLGRAELRARLS